MLAALASCARSAADVPSSPATTSQQSRQDDTVQSWVQASIVQPHACDAVRDKFAMTLLLTIVEARSL